MVVVELHVGDGGDHNLAVLSWAGAGAGPLVTPYLNCQCNCNQNKHQTRRAAKNNHQNRI